MILTSKTKIRLVAIGASTGGIQAVEKILLDLPEDFPCVIVVQHILPGFIELMTERLKRKCRLKVQPVRGGERLERGRVFLAVPGAQLRVKTGPEGPFLQLGETAKISGQCPSIDVLFASCAFWGREALGVILTGMGEDGAQGLLQMRRSGAFTIGQDEATSIVYGMPKAAYQQGAVACQLPLGKIANELIFRTR